ncbi:MAG: VOC family protein [Spirochaetales bacterium]|nr:VOC family protein [Spirochaetales bacterium]
MAKISTYLNFKDCTREAFAFYKTVFHGEYVGDISPYGDMPLDEGMPPLPAEAKELIMHMALKIPGGHILHGSDTPDFMGQEIVFGNSVTINIEPDSREETDRLFKELSKGGTVTMPLETTFWGAYFGMFTDRFGINWMINFEENSASFKV